MNELKNLNEIFRKDVTYDNIQSHKKQGFTLFSEDIFLEKPQGGVKLTTPRPPSHPTPAAFLGLKGSKVPTSKKRKV